MPGLRPALLSTPRLRLRWLDMRDVPAQFAIFSDPAVVRYWSGGRWTDMAQAEQAVAKAQADYHSGGALRFAVERADTGEMIGNVSLFEFYPQSRRCEIGYAIASAHWNHGFATEAVVAALGYAFEELGINRVEADIDPRNGASARVLERLGFQKEGYMPERWIVNGEPADTVYYGLLRRHWNFR
jgi:RimJ/RimL family protein N-acetyltransferase